MARRIVIHAGFHKTGTTTTQATLMQNGKHLWPTYAIVLPARLNDPLRMATLHSTLRDPVSLGEFGHRMRAFLATLDLGARRGLVISAENIAGLIPGRKKITGYDAAPQLLAEAVRAVGDTFGAVHVEIVFTLRAQEAWLRSSYWQNLRSSRLVEDWDTYAARLSPVVDLPATVDAVRNAVQRAGPGAWVRSTAIEALKDADLGPATPVIDAMDLDPRTRAALVLAPARNAAPGPEVVARILEMNRSAMHDDICARAKADLLGVNNL